MSEVGIRALKQNASAVVARASSGEIITVTDRGRAVAQLTPLRPSTLEQLVATGRARPARRRIRELGEPADGASLSDDLLQARQRERF